MSKKLIAAIAVMSFAILGTAFAAVENVKVSGDINTEGVTRDLTLGASDSSDVNPNDEQFVFSQVRLRFDADLTEGVSAVVRLINERIWGGSDYSGVGDAENSQGNTDVNLDLAYIELKEFVYQPLTVLVGRQNLRLGNGLIIGDPDTNRRASASKVAAGLRDLTLRKSFDAVRGILDYAPWTIDLIYAKVEENTLNLNDDVTLVGINAAYDWSSYNGVSEAYFFSANKAPLTTSSSSGANIDSNNKVYVLGGRAQADLSDKLTLGAEAAWQFGDYMVTAQTSHRHLNAYAAQLLAEYKLLDAKNTKLGMNYTYLSGDNGSSGSAYNGWDPLFEDQTPGELINIYFANTNMQYWKASASTMPREDVTVGLDYTYARLVQDNGSSSLTLTNTSASTAGTINLNTTEEKEIGHEIGLWGLYDYTEDVQLKLITSWFIPGDVFANTNDNTGYSIRGGVNVDF
jgi:hypothetical protein